MLNNRHHAVHKMKTFWRYLRQDISNESNKTPWIDWHHSWAKLENEKLIRRVVLSDLDAEEFPFKPACAELLK